MRKAELEAILGDDENTPLIPVRSKITSTLSQRNGSYQV